MALQVKTKKEILVDLNGLHSKFFLVHDHINSIYKVDYDFCGEFVKENKDFFERGFSDEESAIKELIHHLNEFNPLNPYSL